MNGNGFGFLLLALPVHVLAYVFDVDTGLVVQRGADVSASAMFGYSVDMIAAGSGQPWVFAGAPKDVVDGVVGGSFSACSLDVNAARSDCVRRRASVEDSTAANATLDDYQDQLLGVSVAAVKDGSQGAKVWTCAPSFQRFKEKEWPGDETKQYESMLGQCFSFCGRDSFSSVCEHVVPLADKPVFFGRRNVSNEYAYGTTYAQLGMSMHLREDAIVFGAPGAWNWTGTVTVTDSLGRHSVMTQPWSPWEPILNDYAGYAVTSGVFVRRGTWPRQLAVGAPRAGPKRAGAVFVVGYDGTEQVAQIGKISGLQTGEYFGAAVSSADINGDGVDEILVGAPLFANEKSISTSRGAGYEEGRISVYVYRPDVQPPTFVQAASLFGSVANGRFGAAVASVGDLDSDGFGDFVVGSPYEANQRGAVRVFFGKKDIAMIQEAAQVITSSSLSPQLRGFGFSFSTATDGDIDGNGVRDLAVGSPVSGHVVVLRGRRSAWADITASASVNSIDIANVKDFDLKVCVTLRSFAHASPSRLSSLVTLKSDSRCSFVDKADNNVSVELVLVQDVLKCNSERIKVSVKPGFNPSADEAPLRFEITVSEAPRSPSSAFCAQCAVLDPRRRHQELLEIPFNIGCGENNVCESDLSISVKGAESFVIGSSDVLKLSFVVTNVAGEPAFRPRIKVQYPQMVNIRKEAKECKQTEDDGPLTCDVAGPLAQSDRHEITIDFDTSRLLAGMDSLSFSAEVHSASQGAHDGNAANNQVRYNIRLLTEADVEVSAPAKEDRVPFEKGSAKSVSFTQAFQVKKFLSTPLKGITLEFDVPLYYGDRQLFSLNSTWLQLTSEEPLDCVVEANVRRVGAGAVQSHDDRAQDGNKWKTIYINCTTPGISCVHIRCPAFDLVSNTAAATGFVKMETLPLQLKELDDVEVAVATVAHARLPKHIQDIIQPGLNSRPDNAFYLTVLFEAKFLAASVPWWQVVLGVVGGLIVLLLIIILLVKLNFFKRKFPPGQAQQEGQDFEPEEAQSLQQE